MHARLVLVHTSLMGRDAWIGVIKHYLGSSTAPLGQGAGDSGVVVAEGGGSCT